MDSQTRTALEELEAWADESAHAEGNQTPEEQPCLTQPKITQLLSLMQSVKGSPLPDALIPELPR